MIDDNIYAVIKAPHVSERASVLSDKLNKYVFKVDVRANKSEVKKAVEEIFSVKVLNVNVLRQSGKRKTKNTKSGLIRGVRASFKKAFVTLQKGDEIDFVGSNKLD